LREIGVADAGGGNRADCGKFVIDQRNGLSRRTRSTGLEIEIRGKRRDVRDAGGSSNSAILIAPPPIAGG